MPSNQYNSSYTGINHDTYVTKEQLIDLVYPVGSYYMSESSTNPTVFFGGSWEQIKDKFILAAGDSYTAGATGGNASHSHTTNAGTTGGPSNNSTSAVALSESQLPKIDSGTISWHGQEHGTHIYNISGKWYGDYISGMYQTTGQTNGAYSHGSLGFRFGGGGSHSHTLNSHTHSQTSVGTSGVPNMPPYLVAYIWKRIA